MLCEEMFAKRTSLIFYCKLKCLSLENVLTGIFEPRDEIYLCLTDGNHWNVYMCSDSPLIMKLAYLSDIFEKMNTLNTWQQGDDSQCFV